MKSENEIKEKKYMCICCHELFDKLPKERGNECKPGFCHKFIKTKNLIGWRERNIIVERETKPPPPPNK